MRAHAALSPSTWADRVLASLRSLDAGLVTRERFVADVVDPNAVSALIGALRRGQSDDVASAVVEALARIGDRRARSPIEVVAHLGGPRARHAALKALARWQRPCA